MTNEQIERAAEVYATQKTEQDVPESYGEMTHRRVAMLFDSYDIEQAYEDGANFALGKQEKGADAVIQGWVARDKDEELYVHKTKSYRGAGNHGKPEFGVAEAIIKLSKDSFPDLTWSDDPEPVEIIIKRKKND